MSAGLHWPAVRRTLAVSIVALVALASLAATARPATSPVAAAMLPDAPDFPKGATVVSEGPHRDPRFPKFAASSTYSRSLRNVRIGAALLLTLQGSAAVAKNVSDPATFMSSLLFVSRSKVGHEALLKQAKGGFGASSDISSVTLLRARDLDLRGGDEGVEFVFRMHAKTGAFDVGEEWVQVGRALAYLVYAANPGLTAGQGLALVKTMEGRMRVALEPPPVNTVPPAVTGTPQVGGLLTATSGTWTATAPTFAYQWLRCAASGQCSPVAGATSATYTAAAADQGSTLVASVTATTAGGSATAKSPPTAAVA
jgi:hypothetical protein